MPNDDKASEMISVRTFMRQLRFELEQDLLEHINVKTTRGLRQELRRLLEESLDNQFRSELRGSLDNLRSKTLADLQPHLERIREESKEVETVRFFQRLHLSIRVQHGAMALACVLLIVTGLPLKFPDVALFAGMMNIFGGIENSTFIHRIAATMLIGVSMWHLIYIIFFKEGRKDFLKMLPTWKDIKDVFHMLMYFFGRRKTRPKFGRFSYVEKFDYWAVYWGCVIMIGTGMILWSPELTFSVFPKYVYDIAKEVHSDEALLATLAIVIWHFYNVHFNPSTFPGSLLWWHGRISEHDLKDEHPLEYEDLMAREAEDDAESSEVLP
jgi:cytochrome b subunit of formate dehydrogenase